MSHIIVNRFVSSVCDRFYNNNSSFVHGGLEAFDREGQPAVGQKQIHQCIQQLNFRDCHAKITQVDSQATLGNGVVVQVSRRHIVFILVAVCILRQCKWWLLDSNLVLENKHF